VKLGDGVEQAIHCTSMLAGLSDGAVLSAAALAEYHGVSTSYLLKHLQALSGAGVLETTPGPRGGYRLARAPEKISLLDIVLAVEGAGAAFRCNEIRQRGPKPPPKKYFARPCGVAAAMLRAEKVYRAELAKTSIAGLIAELEAEDDGTVTGRGCAFLELNQRTSTR
jgi:Rrf2 family protein